MAFRNNNHCFCIILKSNLNHSLWLDGFSNGTNHMLFKSNLQTPFKKHHDYSGAVLHENKQFLWSINICSYSKENISVEHSGAESWQHYRNMKCLGNGGKQLKVLPHSVSFWQQNNKNNILLHHCRPKMPFLPS